jgi:hypothetical protein
MKKNILMIIAIIIIVGGGAFYGGIKYAEAKNKTGNNQPNGQNFGNLTPEQRQQFANRAGGRTGNTAQQGGFTSGQIISQDAKSITIKLRDGGSKIIFISDKTEISKFAAGTASDLAVDVNVSVNGSANSDGSITAQTVQIRPDLPNNPSGQNASTTPPQP